MAESSRPCWSDPNSTLRQILIYRTVRIWYSQQHIKHSTTHDFSL